MSSFICSEKDFTRITKLVVKGMNLFKDPWGDFSLGIKNKLKEAFNIPEVVDLSGAEYKKTINKIYKQIKKLNYDAVFERYQEEYSIDFLEQNVFYSYNHIDYQDYKTLQCYLYQCSEGDITETKIFKALKNLEFRIAQEIVERQPGYADAEWGEQDE